MTAPFAYPDQRARRHAPGGYEDYASYRPWLRDDFDYRCAYCLLREQWGRFRGFFAIDHFLPVVDHRSRETDYANLLYACVGCNASKGDRSVPDPLVAMTAATVRVTEDGMIRTSDPEAGRLIQLLKLDDEKSTEFRSLWISIVTLAQQHDPDLYRRIMSYPNDLPNLRALQPPAGNERPGGVNDSAFARRERGELPDVY